MSIYTGASDTRYGFIVGALRVREKSFLDNRVLELLIDAPDFSAAVKILAEMQVSGFEAMLTQTEHQHFPESALIRQVLSQARDDIMRSIPDYDKDLVQLFFFKYDIHTIQICLKRTMRGLAIERDSFAREGNMPVKKLVDFVSSFFSEIQRPADILFEDDLRAVIVPLVKEKAALDVIDYTLTQLLFQVRERTLKRKKTCSALVRRYFAADADIHNVRLLLTSRYAGFEQAVLKKQIVRGGLLEEHMLLEAMMMPLEKYADLFVRTPYSLLIREAAASLRATGSMSTFERLAVNFCIAFMQPAKWVGYGIEPIMGHLIAIENQINQIRHILLGKVYHLTPEHIRATITESYV